MTGTSGGAPATARTRDEDAAHAEAQRAGDVVRHAVADHHRFGGGTPRRRRPSSKIGGCGFMKP